MVLIPIKPPIQPAAGQRAPRAAAAPSAHATAFDTEPLVMPFTILYDRQERAGGWRFGGLIGNAGDKYRPLIVPTREEHLKTADYAVEGVPCFVERKSAEDFLSTIIHGRDRFEREHQRMVAIREAGGQCFVIVEAHLSAILATLTSGESMRRIHPNSVTGSVDAFAIDYGIPWIFLESRRAAEERAFGILRKAWERQQKSITRKAE